MATITKKWIGANQVGASQIRLENNNYLKGRNAADSADISILKINTANSIEFAEFPYKSGTPTLDYSLVNKSYVDSAISSAVAGLEFLNSVKDRIADPPVSPVLGDRYLIIATASGDWTGKENQIAYYTNLWNYTIPTTGMIVSVDDETDGLYYYGGASWTKKSWENSTTLNLLLTAGYAAAAGTVAIADSIEVAIEKLDGNCAAAQADASQGISDAAAVANDVGHLVTLSGVAVDADTLGTFTGSTIPDSSDNKEAFQALETAVETAQSDASQGISDAAAVANDVGHLVTLSGVAVDSDDLGTFTGSTIADSSDVKEALQALETAHESKGTNVSNLITLSGVAANEPDLGTFTGSTIADDSTVKAALQALETAVESAASAASAVANDVGHIVTLSGVAVDSDDLGTFTGATIADNSDIKEALQALETAVEGGVGAKTNAREILTLDADDITAGYIDLAQEAVAASVLVSPVGGLIQEFGVDFTLSVVSTKTRITFAGELDTLLVAGDKLIVHYQY